MIILSATALVAALLAWFLGQEGLDKADKWSSVVFGSVGSLAIAAGALFRLWQLGAARRDGQEVALARLAEAQREQWTAEQAARRIRDPWPLNVRWLSSARAQAVSASWASVRGKPGGGSVDLDGVYGEIADLLERDDVPRRLVVLGDPGTGKSMLVLHLTLELLQRRAGHGPVPVLLTAASWNPVQPLDEWIATQIVSADGRLGRTVPAPGGGRRTLARELVARGSILPVLDGLDEMNDEFQRAALIGISAAAAAGRELVVTSRTVPYEAAVRACGPIPAASVVELQPIAATEAAQHLADSAAMADTRWAGVLHHLRAGASTPLTGALSTPLMIWLARMVYQSPRTSPDELLLAEWATSRVGIEEHLLEHLVPAAYASTQTNIGRTRRWLSVLARHMRAERTYDLAWWQINEIKPVPAAQLISIAYVILTALVVNIFSLSAGASVVFADEGLSLLGSIFLGSWLGVFVAFGRMLFTDRHHPRRITWRGLRSLSLVAGLPLFLIGSVTGHPANGLGLALSAGLVAACASGAEVAPSAVSPLVALAKDRAAALLSAGITGATEVFLLSFGVSLAQPWPWLGGLSVALAAILLSAWGQFVLATLVLGVTGRTPWQLLRGLDEACDRGVLRRAGSVYQFRHGLLRNRLATLDDNSKI
ncbi:NACHT domain-containing protein [Actinoplanes sp. NPDC026619]|uniref:NACHT domain-containing protein n=1 Tax=Actinoplanes sp. NPDC026619 TaxID=3155798 RepID=UPI0033F3CBEC